MGQSAVNFNQAPLCAKNSTSIQCTPYFTSFEKLVSQSLSPSDFFTCHFQTKCPFKQYPFIKLSFIICVIEKRKQELSTNTIKLQSEELCFVA